jgi:hypothetical protein
MPAIYFAGSPRLARRAIPHHRVAAATAAKRKAEKQQEASRWRPSASIGIRRLFPTQLLSGNSRALRCAVQSLCAVHLQWLLWQNALWQLL